MPRQQARRFRTKDGIESILKEYWRRGRSQRDFAALRGIPISSLVYWLSKARGQKEGQARRLAVSPIVPVKLVGMPPEDPKVFFEVVLRGDPAAPCLSRL